MKSTALALALLAGPVMGGTARAAEGPVPTGVPRLDHVFVIMMENHGYKQIIGNPSAPFINAEAKSANLATNYYGVAHPSLTNYLEVVGGSNFGVLDDNPPDWHNTTCKPNLATGKPNFESVSTPICPIAGTGIDAATPAIDTTNESPPYPTINIDGTHGYPAAPKTVGKTIADQLTAAYLKWKTYQEDAPWLTGTDRVNYSDGTYSNLSDFSKTSPSLNLSTGAVVQLYAVKHNPFAYFASTQAAVTAGNLPHTKSFDGPDGVYAEVASGDLAPFIFIAPNQCNDMHGRGAAKALGVNGGVGPFCTYDPNDNGTQAGLNPALITLGDRTVQKLVTAIKAAPVWTTGKTAIVILWDENDYSISPINNKVVTIIDKNYGRHGVQSATYYTHFSLLKSLEAGFGLPCLNHACDATTAVMTDLFN